LKSRANQQQLKDDFEDYLNGFSPYVQDILANFEFRGVLARLSKNDGLHTLIEKFLDPDINLSPNPVLNGDGSVKHPAMDNHSMGTVFEELVRKFNEENNEEAGEHWTPRDAVRLMTTLMFRPIADQVKSGSYLLYDCACGTGGMLTVAEETLRKLSAVHGQKVETHLYGQEINPETYAICKADRLLKGEGQNAEHIVGGADKSTLSHDAFPVQEFDFMLANQPYGKSWKKDLEEMGGKDGMLDPRFSVMHRGEPLSLVTRSSDGQLLFLANMASKMNHKSALGSRIAEVQTVRHCSRVTPVRAKATSGAGCSRTTGSNHRRAPSQSVLPHGYLGLDDVKSVWIGCPPLDQQKAICNILDVRCAGIIQAMAKIEVEIGLIQEYRARLVADVVTGQLDVREAARSLPDVEAFEEVAGDSDVAAIDETDDEDEIA